MVAQVHVAISPGSTIFNVFAFSQLSGAPRSGAPIGIRASSVHCGLVVILPGKDTQSPILGHALTCAEETRLSTIQDI